MAESDSSGDLQLYNSEKWHDSIRIGRVKMHVAIFKAYAELHDLASIMAARMDEVLDNDEHQMIMREAAERGYVMPDVEAVRARNNLLKQFLAASDPWGEAEIRNRIIRIPAKTARDMHMVAHQSALMVDEVCRNIRESDYMLLFRNLKRLDVPYTGPTSLQEMYNVWGMLVTSTVRQAQLGPERSHRLPVNWLKLV